MPEPRIKLRQWLWAEGVDPELRLVMHLDKTGVAENAQVPRSTRASNWQQRSELTRRRGALTESFQHGSSTRIRKRLKEGVHVVFVPYWVRTCQVTLAIPAGVPPPWQRFLV